MLMSAPVMRGRGSGGAGASDPGPVEFRLAAGAEYFQRPRLAHGVGPDEDPVLPCRKAAEDAGFHRLDHAEAQVRLHAGERIRREARALLEGDANLVVPV